MHTHFKKDLSENEEAQDLILKCVEIGISKGWGNIPAKWKGGIQTLLVHGWNAASMTIDIMNFLGDFERESRRIGLIASFFHDYTKAENQHDVLPEAQLRELVESLDLAEEELKEVYAVITEIENPTTPDRLVAQIGTRRRGDRRISDVCRLADQLLVIRSLTAMKLTKGARDLLENFNLNIEYHLVSPVRGVSTQMLHGALEEYYRGEKFEPILHFPEGTLYIGRGQVERPEREVLLKNLKNQFDKLFNENSAFKHGGRAFGTWTATLITDVALALRSRRNIESFWDTVYEKPIITGWLTKNRSPEALYQAVFYLFYALKALVTELAERITKSVSEEQLHSGLQKLVREELGLSQELSNRILTISIATPQDAKKQIGEDLVGSLQGHLEVTDRSPVALLETLREQLVAISEELGNRFMPFVEIVPEEVLESLLDDVSRPLPLKVREDISGCWKAFLSGKKKRGTPICCFCARPARKNASASLFGKGAESFNNLLAGGSKISGSNKAKTCLLCEFEERLRNALRGDYEEVIYVFPQVNLSRSLWSIWNETSQALLTGVSGIGVELNPLSRYVDWSKAVLAGRELEAIDSLKNFYNEVRRNRVWIKQLARQLESHWPIIENLKSWAPRKIQDYNELAEAILAGEVKMPPDFKEQLADSLIDGARINFASNPNFIVVLTDTYSLKVRRDESETTLTLRKLFVGLLLSKLLHSTVVFPDMKLETIGKIEPRGAVYKAQRTGLKRVARIIGVKDGWISFSESSNALKYISALSLCEKYLQSSNTDMGKDTLIKLPGLIPGQILNRYLQSKRKANSELLMILDIIEEARREAGFMSM